MKPGMEEKGLPTCTVGWDRDTGGARSGAEVGRLSDFRFGQTTFFAGSPRAVIPSAATNFEVSDFAKSLTSFGMTGESVARR